MKNRVRTRARPTKVGCVHPRQYLYCQVKWPRVADVHFIFKKGEIELPGCVLGKLHSTRTPDTLEEPLESTCLLHHLSNTRPDP